MLLQSSLCMTAKSYDAETWGRYAGGATFPRAGNVEGGWWVLLDADADFSIVNHFLIAPRSSGVLVRSVSDAEAGTPLIPQGCHHR